jgi:hypothetical protein
VIEEVDGGEIVFQVLSLLALLGYKSTDTDAAAPPPAESRSVYLLYWGTKVQILTQLRLLQPRVAVVEGETAQSLKAKVLSLLALLSTKVQILTPEELRKVLVLGALYT